MVNIDDKIDWVAFYSERLPTKPKPAGDHKQNACCPFHNERNPSFWFNTANGMWKCESGCGSGNATSFLARYEGIETQEAWKKLCKLAGVDTEPRQKLPMTLQAYSDAKHLPMDYLKSLGLGEAGNPAHVTIPYYNCEGTLVAVKQRYHPRNTQRFGWDKGGKPTLYGLWQKLNLTAPAVLLVEGESDAQSCWLHGLPAYGVPGATNYQSSWAQFLGSRDVYIHVEPDHGGAQFKQKTLERLKEAKYEGKVYTFACHDIDPVCKDPSDLHVKYGDDFRKKIDPAIRSAHLEDLSAIPEGMMVQEAREPEKPEKTVPPLNVYSSEDLYYQQLEAPPVIVRDAIPAGLTVLAGAPKRGKSWLSLALGIAVASGRPWLGMETQQGDVLYLDLESSKYRVQTRLKKLLAGPGPKHLYIAHESQKLDNGLLEQVQAWTASVEHPVLVIIDTLGRVDGERKRGENAYQSDTRILGELQSFALQQKLGVVCVHHLKKSSMGVMDPFELISGSMGISGAADAVLLLNGKRGEKDCTLSISGRDFDQKEFVLMLDDGRWILKSTNSQEYLEEQRYLKSPYVKALIRIAKTRKLWQGTSSEFRDLLLEYGVADAGVTDIRTVNKEIMEFAPKLYEREGVVFMPPTKGSHGHRYITIKEERNDGF